MLTGVVLLALVLLALFWRPRRDFSPAEAGAIPSAAELPQLKSISAEPVRGSRTFRTAVLPGFMFMLVDIPLAVMLVAVFEGTTDGLLFNTLVATTAGVPLSVLGSFVISWSFKIVVSASGLKGYSASVFHRTFSWNDIEPVGPIRILTLRYLRLRSISSGKRMWVPLFLRRGEEFRECVETFAPGHRLLDYLSIKEPAGAASPDQGSTP
jgi:hypothetical protein